MHQRQAYIVLRVLLLLILRISCCFAQDNSDSVDAVSYRLYLQQSWEQLNRYSDQAIAQGTDYYYLRLRKGIAAFEMKRYRAAITDLEKARRFAPGEQVAASYLYLCYLYTGQYEHARWLSRTFTAAQARYTGSDALGAIDLLYAEGGVKLSDSSRRFNQPVFVTAGCAHPVKDRLFLLHAFTVYTQKEQRFAVQQYQYYLGANLPLRKRWLLSLAGHGALLTGVQNTYSETVITVLNPPPPPGAPPPGTHTVLVTERHGNPFDASLLAGAVGISRSFEWFDIRLGIAAAKLDTCDQYIGSAGLSVYPLRNNKFSLGAVVYGHGEKKFTQAGFAASPHLSAYLTARMHLSIGYLQNSGNNTIEGGAYFINNSVDYTRKRLNVAFSWNLAPNTWISLTAVLENKQNLQERFAYNYLAIAPGIRYIPTKTKKLHDQSSSN